MLRCTEVYALSPVRNRRARVLCISIIGAGIGDLSAAVSLHEAGLAVEV